MRKLVLSAAGALLSLGLAAPALAQDTGPQSGKAPFTGFRVEALVGYDHLGGGGGDSESKSGVAYGGEVGYDAQVGGVVLGVEGEITGSTTDARDYNLLETGDRLRISAGRDLYAGARLGYVVSPRTMIYGKVGYTNARLDSRYDSPTTEVRGHDDLGGYRLGAGVEYNVGPTTYVKAEYRYSHYDKLDGYDVDADRHQILGGVGVRF